MSALLSIHSNGSAVAAGRRLNRISDEKEGVLERLSSGLRITSASDDPAGIALSSSLRIDSRVYTQGVRNLNDGISALSICEGALRELEVITTRQKELAVQASNGTLGLNQRKSLNAEANALVDEFNRIVQATEFNDIKLMDLSSARFDLQGGYGSLRFSLGEDLSRTVGDGTFRAPVNYSLPTYNLTLPPQDGNVPVMADVDGDGNMDAVTAYAGAQFPAIQPNMLGVNVSFGNGDGTFSARRSAFYQSWWWGMGHPAWSPLNHPSLAVRDVTGDGLADIIFSVDWSTGADPDTSDMIRVIRSNADRTFTQTFTQTGIAGLNPTAVLSNDYNKDGKADLVALFGAGKGQVFLGNGDGTFSAGNTFAIPAASRYHVNGSADLNNDGVPDLFLDANSGGTPYIFLGQGDGTFRTSYTPAGNWTGYTRYNLDDLNGDGNVDAVFSANVINEIGIAFGNGDGTFRSVTKYATSEASIVEVLLADINADGIPDILTDTGSRTYIHLANGDGSIKRTADRQINQTLGGAPPGRGAASFADLNSDGALDLVVQTTSLRVLLGNGDGVCTVGRLDLYTGENARAALPTLDATLERVTRELGSLGATQSRINVAIENLRTISLGSLDALGRIQDADVASESADLTRLRILEQLSTAVLLCPFSSSS